jgi:predicted Zn-dependent protease
VRIGSHEQAEEAAERLLRVGVERMPDQASLAAKLGEVLLEQGRAQEARPWFQRALAIAPSTVSGYYGLARVAQAQGQAEAARRSLTQGLRYDPYHADMLKLLEQLR